MNFSPWSLLGINEELFFGVFKARRPTFIAVGNFMEKLKILVFRCPHFSNFHIRHWNEKNVKCDQSAAIHKSENKFGLHKSENKFGLHKSENEFGLHKSEKILSYLLYGSVASLPSPSSNIEAWPYGTSLRFASLLHLGH